MKSATERVADRENILGAFLFGAVIRVVENHDPAAVRFGKPLDKLESEPGKLVPVGNHSSELIAALKSLQYGNKSLAPEVEAAADVGHDLLGAAAPAATDKGSFGGFAPDGVNVIAALSRRCSDCLSPAFISISPEYVLVDSKRFGPF